MTAFPEFYFDAPDENSVLYAGGQCARYAAPPLTILLEGSLGAGKTTFCRGFIRGAGFPGTVKSPTYPIVEEYALPDMTVCHFDLYRFNCPEEWEDAGLEALITADTVALIEWPEKGGSFVPSADIVITLNYRDSGRQLHFQARTEAGSRCLTPLQARL